MAVILKFSWNTTAVMLSIHWNNTAKCLSPPEHPGSNTASITKKKKNSLVMNLHMITTDVILRLHRSTMVVMLGTTTEVILILC